MAPALSCESAGARSVSTRPHPAWQLTRAPPSTVDQGVRAHAALRLRGLCTTEPKSEGNVHTSPEEPGRGASLPVRSTQRCRYTH
nr:MAG TPA: hypothetical protein [Caudoviricetes sp.]